MFKQEKIKIKKFIFSFLISAYETNPIFTQLLRFLVIGPFWGL